MMPTKYPFENVIPTCVPVQHLPFFALSTRFFKNLYSTFYRATMVYDNALTKTLISIQHYTFLPMMLVARFGKAQGTLSLSCDLVPLPCALPAAMRACMGRAHPV